MVKNLWNPMSTSRTVHSLLYLGFAIYRRLSVVGLKVRVATNTWPMPRGAGDLGLQFVGIAGCGAGTRSGTGLGWLGDMCHRTMRSLGSGGRAQSLRPRNHNTECMHASRDPACFPRYGFTCGEVKWIWLKLVLTGKLW